ncbi:MAG: CpsD/CapB family tyrosine-protein kinase [Flavobacteriales bacterium]|nr:CpsD/CapB family tyrosine-protein kinase [Flavobacteriales bacterium]
MRDFFNDRIEHMDDVKRVSPIPILATIPGSKRKRILPSEPKSLLAESFRTARINLQYLNANADRQVIGFTSSSSGEGKTFCAVNLATVLALSGKRTVIVDADMRRPRLGETLGLPEGPGLSTYLIGEAALEDVIVRTDIEGLDAITLDRCRRTRSNWWRCRGWRNCSGTCALAMIRWWSTPRRWDW